MSEQQIELPGYRVYSAWLKQRYGDKVYKLPVNIPVTCPNRDGTLGTGGCIYCGQTGGGHENMSDTIAVESQLEETRAYIAKRYHAKLFIPFFQSFSNTYLTVPQLAANVEAACQSDDIVGVAIATRPDCLSTSHLEWLEEFQQRKRIDVCIELGLQTANDATLRTINRGHSLGDFIWAANQVKRHDLQLCTHVILDLPWDTQDDVRTTAQVVSAVGSDFAKCHALYIEKGTALADWYAKGQVALYNQQEYIERCILFLEESNPDLVLQRIIGRAPKADSVITNWNTSWWKVRDHLHETMARGGHYQGRLYQQGRQKVCERMDVSF